MFKVNALCNQLGLDVDAAGGAIGWAMECYPRGILTEKDTGGLKLHWGDAAVVLELVEKIARREGLGISWPKGQQGQRISSGRDSGYYAMHLKGQDLYEALPGEPGLVPGDDDLHARRRPYDGRGGNPARDGF